MAKIETTEIPYPLFVYCGILPWTFFSTAMANAANSVVGSERLITKIYFPRLIIPYSAVAAAVVDFLVALLLLTALMFWYQIAPTWNILLVPVTFLIIAFAALGVGTGLSAMNVAYRDFRYIIPFIVQIGIFVTPSIFMIPSSDPTGWKHLLVTANPLNALIESFRAALLGHPIPWSALGVSVIIVVLVFVFGNLYFRKVEDRFADII
jgi:lipopolysaccharide transport system permease protein